VWSHSSAYGLARARIRARAYALAVATRSTTFPSRYGPWAVVAGASEGLGAAFAEALAARGLHLILLARRAELLESLASTLRATHGVDVRPLACDLADPSFGDALSRATGDVEIGVAVYNAAYSFVAPLFDRPLADALRVVDVNVRAPLVFLHALVPPMLTRGRGAVVLMSSLAGFQGSPKLAAYAASKAFNTILGESLWAELAPKGVDVVASCAGAIRTPGYAKALAKEAPGTLDASDVAERTLAALGHGPVVIPGATNKLATQLLRRLLSRRAAIGIMGRSVSGLE
jgi:short-subunit dehydrogenase